MRTSNAGISAIRRREGLRLSSYQDDGGVWTVGYGHTGDEVGPGLTITEGRALDYLLKDIEHVEHALERLVDVELTQDMYDAVVSFVFNVGVDAFRRSTLLAKLREKNFAAAADEFARWKFVGKQVNQGLVNRREQERTQFLAGGIPGGAPIEARTMPAPAVVALGAPIVSALVSKLAEAVPAIYKVWKEGDVSDRNVAIATKLLDMAKTVTGDVAPNEQAAVEAISTDVLARARFEEEMAREWFTLAEKSVQSARQFNIELANNNTPVWSMAAFWISVMLMIPLYAVVFIVLLNPDYDKDLRLQVITAVLGVIMLVGGFWLGSSRDSARKTELLAAERGLIAK
jgi:lysozyme